jgi:hypothetical protein
VVMLSGSERTEIGSSDRNWLCIDAVLAAELARYGQPAASAPAAGAKGWQVPDDWSFAVERSTEVHALALAVGDDDDWLVLDRERPFPVAAE